MFVRSFSIKNIESLFLFLLFFPSGETPKARLVMMQVWNRAKMRLLKEKKMSQKNENDKENLLIIEISIWVYWIQNFY